MKKTDFPIGNSIQLETLNRDPYPIFQQLLAQEPISWVENLGMWLVTRRADVITILADPETFASQYPNSPLEATFGVTMITTEGQTQYRLRHPFNEPFLARRLRRSATNLIETISHQLIDAFVAEGEVNLDAAFSDKLSLYTVAAVLGLPIEDYPRLRGWYDAFALGLANFADDTAVRQEAQVAFSQFSAYTAAHLKELALAPNDSALSRLINNPTGDLSEAEIISATGLIIFGGLETTAALLSNTVWALLNHPDQFQAVLADPDLLPGAVEESLRWESPVQTCTRHVTRPVTLYDVTLEPGEKLQCRLGAANRDPAFFENPDRFDLWRPNADQNLAFGRGKHFCLGAALARLEGQIGLRVLFERLPKLRLDPAYVTAPYGHEFRSPPTLYAQWG
jgi:cytochrome P450